MPVRKPVSALPSLSTRGINVKIVAALKRFAAERDDR